MQNGNISFHNSKGKLHREDGPAIIYSDGYKAWYLNGEMHREDGPAVILSNGYKFWWINGNRYLNESDYKEALKIYLVDSI